MKDNKHLKTNGIVEMFDGFLNHEKDICKYCIYFHSSKPKRCTFDDYTTNGYFDPKIQAPCIRMRSAILDLEFKYHEDKDCDKIA